jgi:hypothetical protein
LATAVTVGGVGGFAAVAQRYLLFLLHFEGKGRMVGPDVCAVAKRHVGGFAAGTAVVGSCFEFHDDRLVRDDADVAHFFLLFSILKFSLVGSFILINLILNCIGQKKARGKGACASPLASAQTQEAGSISYGLILNYICPLVNGFFAGARRGQKMSHRVLHQAPHRLIYPCMAASLH